MLAPVSRLSADNICSIAFEQWDGSNEDPLWSKWDQKVHDCLLPNLDIGIVDTSEWKRSHWAPPSMQTIWFLKSRSQLRRRRGNTYDCFPEQTWPRRIDAKVNKTRCPEIPRARIEGRSQITHLKTGFFSHRTTEFEDYPSFECRQFPNGNVTEPLRTHSNLSLQWRKRTSKAKEMVHCLDRKGEKWKREREREEEGDEKPSLSVWFSLISTVIQFRFEMGDPLGSSLGSHRCFGCHLLQHPSWNPAQGKGHIWDFF